MINKNACDLRLLTLDATYDLKKSKMAGRDVEDGINS